MTWRILQLLLILACSTVFLGGCATPHPDRMRRAKAHFEAADGMPGLSIFGKDAFDGKDGLLALEEQGRMWQLDGNYRESSKCYRAAIGFSEMKSDGPVVSVRETLKKSVASTYGNDLSIDYPIVPFEQMMLHVLDGINSLALREWDDYGVNMRNLEVWRNEAESIIRNDVKSVDDALRRSDVNFTAGPSFDRLTGTGGVLSGVNYSTDNAYALSLVALYHEAIGDYSNAEMAYRDVDRICPKTPFAKIGHERCKGVKAAPDEGDVVVIFEESFIPPKKSRRFVHGGLFTTVVWDLPCYTEADCLPYEDGMPLVCFENGKRLARTGLLCDLAPLAVKSHEERIRGILARQISRTSVKAITRGVLTSLFIVGATISASSRGDDRGVGAALMAVGGIGSIFAHIMTVATEKADLRSWLLLPRQVQIARFPMKVGEHDLTLKTVGLSKKLRVEVRPRSITVVYCSAVPHVMNGFSACLDKLKEKGTE